MTITTLEALRDAIRASTGADLRLDRAFALLVLKWTPSGSAFCGWPPGPDTGATYYAPSYPEYLDPLAGPGALFAAARGRWDGCTVSTRTSAVEAVCSVNLHDGIYKSGTHPLLPHALALAMTEAAIQERDNA